ncbi:hypothetical protein NE237_002295 [Protea cynaroides]|uniref:glutaredoxin-dependent peroxiredoxin n=1 Tax=Protea cynaroides TaxID=273540 RepID=A0A9Q0QZ90_9MAGN|nr:hypothetical protein NE237_002295 [Protea cynaroides]
MQWMATGVQAVVSKAFAFVLVGADIVDVARSVSLQKARTRTKASPLISQRDLQGKKVVIFELPISSSLLFCIFTGVCTKAHVPSYKNNIDKFEAKGIDLIICVSINDPYVMNGRAEKLEAKELTKLWFHDSLIGIGPRMLTPNQKKVNRMHAHADAHYWLRLEDSPLAS